MSLRETEGAPLMIRGFDFGSCLRPCSRSRGLRAGLALSTTLAASACANDVEPSVPSDTALQSEALVARQHKPTAAA